MPSTSATRRAGGSHTPPASPPPPAALTRRRGGGQTDGAPLSTPSPSSSSSSLSSPSFLRTVRRCLAPVRRAKSSVRRTRACLRSGGGDLRALARWLAAACLASDEKFDSEEEFFDLDERHLRVGVNKSRAPTRASLFALDVGAQSASPSVCVRSFSSLSPVSQGRGHRDRRTQRQDTTLVLTPPPDDDDEAEVAPSYVSNTVTTPTTSLLHRETSRFALPHSITQRTEARSLSKQKREMSLVLTPTSTRADTGATSVWVHAETDGEAFSHSSRFSAMTPVPHLASGEEADGVGVCLSTSTPPLLSARLENQSVPLNTHSADASWRDSAVCVVNALFVSLSGTSLSSSTLANVKWWLSRRSIALAVCVLVLILGGVLASVAHFNCTYFLRGRVCHRLGQGKHVRYYTKSSTCSARGQLSGTSYHEVLSLRQLSEQMNAAYDAFDEIATWRRRYTDALTAQQQQQHPKQMMVEDEKEEKTVRGYEDVMRDARRRVCRAQLSLTNAFSSRELGWTASHSSTTNTHTPASSSAAESKKTKSKVKDVNKARGDVPTPANPTKAGGAMAGGVKTNISHSNLSNSSRTQAAPRLPASRRHALALEARVAALLESRQRLWNLNTPSNLLNTNSKSHNNNNNKNSSDLHARLSHTPWLTRSPRIRFASFTNMISPTGCTLVASAALSGFHQTLLGYEKAYGHVDRHIRQIEWIAQEGLNDDDVVVLTDSDVAWTGADVAPFLAKFIALSAESEAELDVAKVRAWEDYGEALAPLVMAGLRPSELFLRTRSSCSSAEHESSSDADTRDNTMRSRRTGKTDADVNKDDNDDDERDKNGNKREEAITPCDTARHNWGRLVQMPPILFNAEASCQRSHATKDEASCQSEADVLEIMIATRRNQPKSFDDDLLPFLQPWSRDDEEDQSVELTRASADFLARAVPVLRGAFYGTDVETWRMASAANTSATTATTTQNTRKTAEAAAGATRDSHPLSFDISPAAKRAALALRRAFPLATDAENGVDVSETATSVCVPVPPRFWGVTQAKERDEKDEELPDQTKEGNAHEPRRLSVFRFLDGATRLDPDATPLAGNGFRHCEQYEQQQEQLDEEKQEKNSPDSLHEAVSFWPSRHVKKDADVAAVGEASALPHTDQDVPPTHASSSASSANTTEEAETKEREDISLVKAAMSSTPDSSGLSSEICADEESCGAERGDETESELLVLPLLTSSPTMPGRTREALHHADLNETLRTQEQETEKEESADHAKGKMTTPAAPFYNLSDLLSAMTYNTTSSPSAHSRVSTTAPFKQLSSYSDTSDAAMASASSPTTPTPSTTTATTASEAHTTLEPMPSPPLTSGDATSSRAPLSSSERTPADADYYFANLGGALNPTRHLNAGGLVARVWAYKCLVRGMLRYTREHFPADVSDKEEEGEEGEGGEVRESELAAWIHTYGGRSVPLSAIAQRALYGEPKSNEYLTRRGAGISEVKSNAEKTAATTKDAKATDSVNVSSKKQKKKSQPKRSEKDRAQPDSTAPASPSASSSCRADERGWYNDQAIIASMYVYGRIWEIEEDLLLAPHTSSSASTRREMREKNMANAHDLRPRRQDPYGLPPGLIGIDRASEFFFVTAMSKRGEDYVITTELPAQPEHKKKKSTNGNEPQPKKHTTTTTSSPSPRLTTATVAQPSVWETMTLSDSNVCGSSRFLLRLQCYVMRFLTAPLALVWHTDASAAAEYPQRLFRTETSESAVAVVDAMRRAGTNAALSAVDAQGKNWVCPLYLLSHAGHSENAQDGNSASSQLPSTTWTSLHARRKNALALSRPFVPTSAATATTTLREKDEPIQGTLFRDLLTRTLFPFRSAQDDSLYTPVLAPHGIACERLNEAGKTAVTLSGAVHDTDVRGHDGDEPVRCDEKGSKSETCRKEESQNHHHHQQQQQQQQHAAELPRTQPGTTPATHSPLAAATKSVFRTLWRAADTTTITTTQTVSARTEQADSTTTTTAITQDQPRSVAYVSYPLLARRTTAQDALRDGRWSTLHTALQVSAAYRDLRRMLLTSRPENAMTSSSTDAATPVHRATDKQGQANKHTNGASEGHGEATREEERLFPSLPLTVSDAVYMQTFQHARHEGTNASRFYMFPDDEAHTRAFFSRENRCFMNLVADRWFLSHTEGVSRPETTPNTDQDARTRDFTSQLTSCLANLAPLYAAQHTSSTTRNSVNVSPEWRRALQTYCVLPVPPLSLPLNGREPVKQTATTTSTSSSSSASLHARESIVDEMTREIEAEALARDALYRDHAISVSHFPRLIHFAGDWKDIRYREHRHGFSWFVTGRYDARARAANEAVLDSLEMEWIDDDTAHLFAFTELCGSPYSLI